MSDEMNWGQTPSENSISPKYTHYEIHQEQPSYQRNSFEGQPSGGFSPQGMHSNGGTTPPKKPQKKNGKFGKKLVSTIALAVVFGLVAGVVFQGVNFVSGKFLGTNQNTTLATTEVLPDATGNTVDAEGEVDYENLIAQSGTVAGVAEAVMPSVVAITSVSIQEIPSFFGFGFGYGMQEYSSAGSGSGIIVGENDDELFIATNNHVVEDATTLSVCFIGNDVANAEEETLNLASGDGDINVEDAVTAQIKGTDPDNDLAVVSVKKEDIPDDTMSQLKIAQIGSSDDLVVGEQVVAIGNALGYGQSVTSGWVSALERTITLENGSTAEVLQTDAAINPGNSGGALLNMKGELIGINSAKYADDTVEGMGYAIPISKALPILQELMDRETRQLVDEDKAAYLGVQVADLSTEAIQMYNMPAGAFVIESNEGEAAQLAGIQKGDIIVKLDGQKVSGKEDMAEKLQYYAAGEVVEMIIARANNGEYEEITKEVTLGSRPE